MKTLFLSACLILNSLYSHVGSCEEPEDKGLKNEYVILLHGLGRKAHSMTKIEKRLKDEGYGTLNCEYPSTKMDIEELARIHVSKAVNHCNRFAPEKIHFVTHSLGGILVRQYLQENALPNGGRVIMLSPPNKGSEVAERLKWSFLYKSITGPAGQQLGTGEDSIPNRLRPIDAEIGIITGNKSYDPWFSIGIPGEDDGKVSVKRAKLEEMNDFLVVKSPHAFIMQNPEVIDQIVFYLKNGKFKRVGIK